MQVYILNEYDEDLTMNFGRREIRDAILNPGSVFASLEAAQNAALNDFVEEVREYVKDEGNRQAALAEIDAWLENPELEWKPEGEDEWQASTDITGGSRVFSIQRREVHTYPAPPRSHPPRRGSAPRKLRHMRAGIGAELGHES